MAGSSDLIVLVAIGGAALLFGPQIMSAIQGMIPSGGGGAGAETSGTTGTDTTGATSTSTSTTNIIAPTPLGAYPLGYIPYAGYPYGWPQFPPVLRILSATAQVQ